MSDDVEVAAMVDGLIGRAEAAMTTFLNIAAQQVYDLSQQEVPKSEEHDEIRGGNYPVESLAESAVVVRASPGEDTAQVIYNSPYASAQEAGFMEYVNPRGNHDLVDWRVEEYTTAGTKAHYLEDAGKAVAANGAEELAVESRRAFGDIPGFIIPEATLEEEGVIDTQKPNPSGELEQLSTLEQNKTESLGDTTLEIPSVDESI